MNGALAICISSFAFTELVTQIMALHFLKAGNDQLTRQ